MPTRKKKKNRVVGGGGGEVKQRTKQLNRAFIEVNGQKLETVTSFKYLGSVITYEGVQA